MSSRKLWNDNIGPRIHKKQETSEEEEDYFDKIPLPSLDMLRGEAVNSDDKTTENEEHTLKYNNQNAWQNAARHIIQHDTIIHLSLTVLATQNQGALSCLQSLSVQKSGGIDTTSNGRILTSLEWEAVQALVSLSRLSKSQTHFESASVRDLQNQITYDPSIPNVNSGCSGTTTIGRSHAPPDP